jgi:hypothetical protein
VSEPTTAAGRGHVIIPCDLNADEFAAITRAIRERCEDAAAEARADERARLSRAIKGISLPPGPDFAWVEAHRPFIAAALAVIEDQE